MKAWFSVHVQARAPEAGALRAVISDKAADKLMDLLADHDGVVASGDGRWDVTISVQENAPAEAAAEGAALVEAMASEAGMPRWPLVSVEAVRDDVLDEDNAGAALPELVSAPEAAEILEVSPQRVHELAEGRSFPRPVYDLKVGRLWLRDAVEEYGRSRNRKPGRPDRETLMRQRAASALLDAGITSALARVFIGDDGHAVIMQLAAGGPPHMRRRIAAKAVAALDSAGLGVAAEVSGLHDDIAVYLADGNTAKLFELPDDVARRA